MRSGASGNAEEILQLRQCPAAGVVIAGSTKAVADELLLGVARDGLVQLALVAAHRHPDLHSRTAQVREPLFVGRLVFRLDGHQHLLGHAQRRLVSVQLFEDAIDEPTRTDIFDLVDDEALASDHSTLAHVEDLHRGFQVVVGEADHVDVLAALGNHLLLLDRPMNSGRAGRARAPRARTPGREPPTSSPHRAA